MRFLGFCALSVIIAACGSVVDPNAHPRTLTVALAGSGSGSVSSTPDGVDCGATCSSDFPDGSIVALAATATVGSTFTGWSGGCTGTGSCVVTLHDAATVTATFDVGDYTLAVIADGEGSGTVTSMPDGIDCGSSCAAGFATGTMVTLTATPGTGASFWGWTGGGCSGTGPCTVALTDATAVSATFGFPSLFMIADSTQHLQRVTNLTTPHIVDVGALGTPYDFGDCAWDAADKVFYEVEGRGANSLYTVNLVTGAATVVGVHGITDMFALAWYPPTNTLYGMAPTALYTLNKTTGAATVVVSVSNSVNGMAWDTKRNQMLVTSPGALFATIDLTTGVQTPITGSVSLGDNDGLTYDTNDDKFFEVDYAPGTLESYDPTTATYTGTQLFTAQGAHSCVAYVPDAQPY